MPEMNAATVAGGGGELACSFLFLLRKKWPNYLRCDIFVWCGNLVPLVDLRFCMEISFFKEYSFLEKYPKLGDDDFLRIRL